MRKSKREKEKKGKENKKNWLEGGGRVWLVSDRRYITNWWWDIFERNVVANNFVAKPVSVIIITTLYVHVSFISIQKRAVNKVRQKERSEVLTQKFCLWQIVWERMDSVVETALAMSLIFLFHCNRLCFQELKKAFSFNVHIKFWLCCKGFRKNWKDTRFCNCVYTKSY